MLCSHFGSRVGTLYPDRGTHNHKPASTVLDDSGKRQMADFARYQNPPFDFSAVKWLCFGLAEAPPIQTIDCNRNVTRLQSSGNILW